MSYMGLMEDELTEQCVCGKSYEDHEGYICTCGHQHWAVGMRLAICEQNCDPHEFEEDTSRYCDWEKDGSVFRSRGGMPRG